MRSTDSLWTALVTVSLLVAALYGLSVALHELGDMLEPLTHIVEQEKQRD